MPVLKSKWRENMYREQDIRNKVEVTESRSEDRRYREHSIENKVEGAE